MFKIIHIKKEEVKSNKCKKREIELHYFFTFVDLDGMILIIRFNLYKVVNKNYARSVFLQEDRLNMNVATCIKFYSLLIFMNCDHYTGSGVRSLYSNYYDKLLRLVVLQ